MYIFEINDILFFKRLSHLQEPTANLNILVNVNLLGECNPTQRKLVH